MTLRILPGLALVLAVASAHAQLPPDKAAASFKVADGLEFRLWASEPLFVNPTCIDVDHKGRVWVCESVNYRNKLRRFKKLTRPEGDRIVVLEDADGKGKATKATTFYQSPEILAPLGIAVAPYPDGKGVKVFVCQSPDILVFEDKDGDGKADGPPKKLLSGFGGFDHDHGVHSILIGPDRKLYFTVGDTGVHGLQSSDKKGRKWNNNSTDCRAGTVWKCELDGTKLELVAHNFRNNYECCVDSFGTVFLSDNDDDGNQQTRICHVIPGGNYGYHPRGKGQTHWHEEQPGVVPKILRTYFGSPTGICVYEGKLLPRKYRGALLHTDAGPRQVRAYRLKPKGASYAVEREEIVESKDNWFRPSDVCVGPDGSAYVADWYDPGVGGHGMGDIKKGRIYRLAPTGNKVKNPPVDLKTDKGVLAALASPNLATRAMAMAHIAGMKKEDALELLSGAIKQKEDPVLRGRALWQAARIYHDRRSPWFLENALFDDADPRFQILALRMAKDFLGFRDNLLVLLVGNFLGEEVAPSVRRECLIALRDVDPAEAKDAIYALMKKYDGKDRFYLAAIGIAVGTDPKRREVLLSDFSKHFTTWDAKVAGLVFELRPPGVLPLLEKRLADRKLSDAERASLVDAVAGNDDKKAGSVLLAALEDATPLVRQRILANLKLLLPGKWSGLKTGRKLKSAIGSLLKKPETRVAGLDLLAASGQFILVERAKEFAGPAETPEVRKAAIAAIAALPTSASISALARLAGDKDEAIAVAAVLGLGELGRQAGPKSPRSAEAVQELEGLLGGKPAMREAAVAALAASRPGSQRLLALHAEKKLPAGTVAAAGRLLRSSPYPDLRNKALIAMPAPGKMDPKKLPSIAELAARRGSAAKGRKLFEASAKSNLQCMKCHMAQGRGGQVGPDLSMIGKKASRENMIESILYPSKAVADQYATWNVTNKRGVTVQGLLVEDTPAAVVVRDTEGRDTRIAQKNVEKKEKSLKSLMPEDVAAHLSPEDLVDLVEYLLTLKQASLGVGQWRIVGPFDNGEGMAGLDKAFPPEKGIDLKAVYDGKHGKVKWDIVRPGTNGYVDLAAHYGGKGVNSVSYLAAEIESPTDQPAELVLGNDDGCKVWLDGKLVHTSRETRAATPEQARVKVKLKKGANRVLFKINNGNNPHGLYFRIASEQELKPGTVK